MDKDNNYKIEISHKTIIFAFVFFLILKFLWIVKDLLLSLLIAFIIMSALKPFVIFLTKRRLPKGLSTFIVYFIFLAFFINILNLIIPPLVSESTILVRSIPSILRNISPKILNYINLDSFTAFLPNITNQFIDIFKSIFSNAIFIISTLFFGFYFLLEENIVKRFLINFFPEEFTKSVVNIFDKAEQRMNAWFWGEITLMTVVGLFTFIGLNLIGMKYSLALAVLAGLFEVVPNIGPVLSSIPAIIIGLSHSYILGVANVALYFIVQQLENNLIVPYVMKKAVGLNPIITLISLIVGGKLAGVLGILLAIPITLFLETILMEIVQIKKPAEILR